MWGFAPSQADGAIMTASPELVPWLARALMHGVERLARDGAVPPAELLALRDAVAAHGRALREGRGVPTPVPTVAAVGSDHVGWLSVTQAAERLAVSPERVRRLARDRWEPAGLAVNPSGRGWSIDPAAVAAYQSSRGASHHAAA